MCPAVFLVSAEAISYGAMVLLVKKMVQVEINIILLLSDYIFVCLVFPCDRNKHLAWGFGGRGREKGKILLLAMVFAYVSLS